MAVSVIGRILARPDLLTTAFPPMSGKELRETEKQLGFALPPLLSEVYLKVANGGFGPHIPTFFGGIGGFEDEGHNLVSHYHESISAPDRFPWPEKLITFFHWGCACRCCLDANEENGPVIFYDPGGFRDVYAKGADLEEGEPLWEDVLPALQIEAPSLEVWLDNWLNGTAEMGYEGAGWKPKKEFRPRLQPHPDQLPFDFEA